jgi:type IV secretion system protein VirB10
MSEDPTRGRDVAAALRLRSGPPKVTRLSRRVLIGLGAAAALGVFGLGFWALQSSHRTPSTELYDTNSRNVAAGLGDLPRDYTALPRAAPALGPPLPGDLGRPILAAQGQGPAAPDQMSQTDAEQQRVAQEKQAAGVSGLFVGGASGSNSAPLGTTTAPEVLAPTRETTVPGAKPASDPMSAENQQDQKLAFLNGSVNRETMSSDRLADPASPYVLQAGSVIAAALITGIRSDLPGQVTAQVTENVYDSPTGRHLLIPQGARLIGQYDSQVAFAQSRVQLVWTRLVLPDGRSIVLERQPGADPEGYSGLQDGINNHWGTLFKAALLSTILSVGAEAGTSASENNLAQALRAGAANSFSQTGQQIVERNLNVQPTLTIRPGFPVRVIVNRDLVLAP